MTLYCFSTGPEGSWKHTLLDLSLRRPWIPVSEERGSPVCEVLRCAVCSNGILSRSRKRRTITELSSQTYGFPCRYHATFLIVYLDTLLLRFEHAECFCFLFIYPCRICPLVIMCNVVHTTTTVLRPFSGTTRVSRCQRRTSGFYGAREDQQRQTRWPSDWAQLHPD